MTGAEYAYLTDFLNRRSGIALGPEKRYLVEARLGPVARRVGASSLSDLVARLARGDDIALASCVVEAMTTNETSFFRDAAPFAQFVEVMLPTLIAARAGERRLRIWCAACSTGQEPYSLAMLAAERQAALKGWTVEILGTDLSAEVIERARDGLFSQFEVQRGLSVRRLIANFAQEGTNWRIAADLRARVAFRTLNLMRDFAALGRFDVVFCRNVLMYFDEASRTDVLARIAGVTASDGYVVLGAAERLAPASGLRAVPDQSALYAPSPARASSAPHLRAVAG